jgi:saccharopine dehydrogenase (NAD+, L-lysine-forming)
MIKFGIIKEGKVPTDERVPLTPPQIAKLIETKKEGRFVVQRSSVRRIQDSEYEALNIEMANDVSDADVLLGVKEVPMDQLVPGKTHLFFSHTIKMQPYNKKLLQAMLDKKVRLIDWECLRDAAGRRVIGFGRYAGIVGTYNAFRAYGHKHKTFDLKRAHDCVDRKEMESELVKVKLPNIKILLTGRGKVAKGSMEVLDAMNIRKVGIREFLKQSFDEPVYCQITFTEYFQPKDHGGFDVKEFYAHPERYKSDFMRFAKCTDMLITGHFWDSKSPYLFTREDARSPDFNIRLVADISCDIDGPVASTLRPSSIDDPFYGYDPIEEKEVAFDAEGAITVMAVDNLPCELPRDASFDFGEMFISSVLPSFLNGDKKDILKKATIAQDGEITEHYAYLRKWVNA